jgi:hypothetical protein
VRNKWTRNGDYKNAQENCYRYVEHFISSTGKKRTCYVEKLLKEQEYRIIVQQNWDYILKRGLERIELAVNKWQRRIRRMLQFVTDTKETQRIQNSLQNIGELIYFEELPGLYVHVLSNKGNLTSEERTLLRESKKEVMKQTQIKEQLDILRKLSKKKKKGVLNIKDKEAIEVLEKSREAFQFISNPFFDGLDQWYHKYAKKILEQRKKEWKKKLSDGRGKQPNEYSGILSPRSHF